MFTNDEAKSFQLSYQKEVKFLSRMSRQGLNTVYGRTLREMGHEVLFGGPSSKDELITAILDLHGMDIHKINESIHVLYHSADMPNEACGSCVAQYYEDTSDHYPSTEDADGF